MVGYPVVRASVATRFLNPSHPTGLRMQAGSRESNTQTIFLPTLIACLVVTIQHSRLPGTKSSYSFRPNFFRPIASDSSPSAALLCFPAFANVTPLQVRVTLLSYYVRPMTSAPRDEDCYLSHTCRCYM